MARLEFGGNVRRSMCSLCPQHCGLLVEVKDGRATRFIGDKANPISAGKLCVKGAYVLDFHSHAQRLNHPLKRVGARGENRWQKIGWDQALDEIAAKLALIRECDGPERMDARANGHGDRFACRRHRDGRAPVCEPSSGAHLHRRRPGTGRPGRVAFGDARAGNPQGHQRMAPCMQAIPHICAAKPGVLKSFGPGLHWKKYLRDSDGGAA